MKDYAKRPTRSARHQPSNGTWFNNLMLLFAILFAGFACVHLFQEYLLPTFKSAAVKNISSNIVTMPKKNILNSSPVKVSAKKTTVSSLPAKTSTKKNDNNQNTTTAADTNDQPKFDFYKLLPQMTVKISTDDDNAVPIINNKSVTKQSASPVYVLQVAALQKDSDATQVQNTLKAAGYTAFTQSYQAPDHTTWYRVLIGPFNNIKTAQAEQDKLDAHQTEALLTTLKN